MTGDRTWVSWQAAIWRCKRHRDYLAKNITVAERWLVFENFLADMGPRPPRTSLDRIDNSQGYRPGNCRWASGTIQNRNRDNNRLLTVRGETKPASAWCAQYGIPSSTLCNRLARGWDEERAVTAPRCRSVAAP